MPQSCVAQCHLVAGAAHPHPITMMVTGGTWVLMTIILGTICAGMELRASRIQQRRAHAARSDAERQLASFAADFHWSLCVTASGLALVALIVLWTPELVPHRPYLLWSVFLIGVLMFGARRRRWLLGHPHPSRRDTQR